jgi:hypothetical protein
MAKEEKWERHKLTTNTMHIPGGHQRERLREGPLGRGLTPLVPDEDDPVIMDATGPVVGEGGGTYKTPSK